MRRCSFTHRKAMFGSALVAALVMFDPVGAHALDLALKVEPGVAIPLTHPQSQIYGVGGAQSLKLLFGLTPFLDVGPTVAFLYLPPAGPRTESGVGRGLGAGIRLKRPHDADTVSGVSPWFDADALYIRTGPLNRPAFDAAVGVAVPLGSSRTFWLGPFVRYLQVMQFERVGYDNTDAKVLTLGISLEVGSGVENPPAPAEIRTVVKEVVVTKEVPSCPDGDHDGVPDGVDHCPDVAGAMENWGCPTYKKLVVKPDKLELKEKLYFAWNQAKLEDASLPVLDEVVQALTDNKGFRVQVEGHTDSSGADDRNQTLSEQRAQVVVDYLVAHGISKDRLASKGFGSSVPLDNNATVDGREHNRRVEFVVHFTILNTGSPQ